MLKEHVCEICDYWKRLGTSEKTTFGRCRRFPPQVLDEEEEMGHVITFEVDQCGEWRARE